VIELGEAALKKCQKGSDLRADRLDLLGDAFLQSSQPQKALDRYRELMSEFPSYKEKANTYLAMANAELDLAMFREGIDTVRKAMAELPDDPLHPYFYEWLWKLQSAEGDLTGLLNLVGETQKALPARMQREGIGKTERETCERILVYNGFRVGYVRFALGDFSGAVQAFRELVAFVDKLEKERGSVPEDYKVYRDIRTKDNLGVLESKIGHPPQADLSGVLWAGERKPALDGRPLAVVFRSYGDDRSAPFLQALDRHALESKAFELAAISFVRGEDDPPTQAAKVLAEARALGLECPVGLDPDLLGKGLFRAFNVPVGSATFVILDRDGKYVWFQEDPRAIDVRFSQKILDRIVGSR
jgi:tetratricopeptide (TPR) repeat protein